MEIELLLSILSKIFIFRGGGGKNRKIDKLEHEEICTDARIEIIQDAEIKMVSESS